MTTDLFTDQLTLPLLHRLLGTDDETRPDLLIQAAYHVRSTVPQLLLSVIERDGHELGTGSTDALRRARERGVEYEQLLADVRRTVPDARIIKGQSLASYFPPELIRPVGDVDILVDSEDELWRTAVSIMDARPVETIALELHGSEKPLPFVTLGWSPADPWMDKPLKAELFCTPLLGNGGSVGLRQLAVDRNGVIVDILSVCEEAFQRPFNAKDVADILALADADLPPATAIAEAAADHALAPELQSLLTYAAEFCDIGVFSEVLARLEAPARTELERREAWRRPERVRGRNHPVWRWLAHGVPVPSVLLQRRDRPDAKLGVRIEAIGDHVIYRSPIGDFLLTIRDVVPLQDFEAAMERLDALDETAAAS